MIIHLTDLELLKIFDERFLVNSETTYAEVFIQSLRVLREMLRLSVLWEMYCIYYFDILGNFLLS